VVTTALRFLGGAGTVTGSKFLLETPTARVLVDCGLFQGAKSLRLRNWEPPPVDPREVDAVVLTHAHLDHCGYLPAFVRDGFTGPVLASAGTIALAAIVLVDSGHLQEEDADFANRAGFSKHRPALPLYTEVDASRALIRARPVPFGQPTEAAPGVAVELLPAGHILGASSAVIRVGGGPTVVFSGDLGRDRHPLLLPPAHPPASDALVVESTYGDTDHHDADLTDRLADAIVRTARRGGTVVIPAFAVDRTEIVLFHLARLRAAGAIPNLPVAVDSPMALAALDVYVDAIARREPELRPEVAATPDPFDLDRVERVHDVERSKQLDRDPHPKVIVSASGMATGGRVLHHLARYLPDRRNSVALVGFQVPGTRGWRLAQGERTLKMHGRYLPVRAEVVDLQGMSAHADRRELLAWVGAAPGDPVSYVVHGEPDASQALAWAITDRDAPAVVPTAGERVLLG
jgi:metallo-beta-lactamase family protein